MVNIHDFGQALLGDIYNSPRLRKDGDTPIILIGHSMGGLVIKKAYLLAKQDPSYYGIGMRFHSIFFLATPHRGADSAQMLNNILRVSMSHESKAYVNDLIPNSGAIQAINDEFRHVYQGSHLWTFFETLKTSFLIGQEMIVEKDSAVIGLPNERIQLLNADHQHICKFTDPLDNNYLTLRNAFISTIESIDQEWSTANRDEHRDQMKNLSVLLGVSETPEGILSSVVDKQMEGTCQWLTDRSYFHEWQEGHAGTPKIFWLNGKPATGKSTVAGHVIKYLENCGSDCSYFFFRRSDKASSSISDLLRSLAFQMAFANRKVRQALLNMKEDGESFNKNDERTVWRTVFMARIFRIELKQPHYWIIDALDECPHHNAIFSMLSKVDKDFPLRLFITSRPSPVVDRLFSQEKLLVFAEQITVEDSLQDIRTFLEANSNYLPVEDDSACRELISTILEKSSGCFLWAALVLKELESTYSEQQIWEVLRDVPTEMDELYTRILDGMMTLSRDKELAVAIIRWTVFAARPLTTDELKEALKLDINQSLPRLENAIGSICGNLIQVNKQSRVEVIHQTVRAFLIKDGLDSDFAMEKVKENSRLAEVCLKYLGGEEMKNPRNRRGNAGKSPMKRSPFTDYASLYFSNHIARSSPLVDKHFMLLENFLNTNVLTWVEYIARSGNLYSLTQAAKNLKSFLERRAKYRSPLGQAVHVVDAWANDLIRLVAAFGQSLIASPASIYSLIPPVCPPQSMLYKNFGNLQPCLKVMGRSEEDWDDLLSCVVFAEERATAIACRDARFALGLASGTLIVYYTSTLQEARRLHHKEPVRHLQFSNLESFLASSGRRSIKLWNAITGVQLWAAEHHNDILTLNFNENDTLLRAATRTNQIAFWDVSDGKEQDTCPIHENMQGDEFEYRPPATHAQFSTDLNMLAIAHRQRPISFWDLASNTFIGQFYVENAKRYPGPLLLALVFNPNPDISLLAASYQQEQLVVLDPWTQEEQAIIKFGAHVLAASPDGKTLAAGDGSGAIQLHDFETLRLIHRITASDYNVSAMVFASNNLRFFDIRNDHCNIWEPSVLVRQIDSSDTQSESVSAEIPGDLQVTGASLASIWDGEKTITAMIDHHLGHFVFCGREDGSIGLFQTDTGKQLQTLYHHARNTAISSLCWNQQENLLASTDISGRFLARKLTQTSSGQWTSSAPLLDQRSTQAISQLLISSSGKFLLLSTATSDELWSMTGQLIESRGIPRPMPRMRINHSRESNHVVFFDDSVGRIFEWDTFKELTPETGITLETLSKPESLFTDVAPSYGGRNFCITFFHSLGSHLKPHLNLWLTSSLHPGAETAKAIGDYSQLATRIKSVIGVHKSSLLFLDYSGWVCSTKHDIATTEKFYVKHFFIPYGWHSGAIPVMGCTVRGHVILARRDEILVFQRGLDFEEKVEFG